MVRVERSGVMPPGYRNLDQTKVKDLSIVIAHRGDALGLWATISSCTEALRYSDFDYEFCICVNGERHTKHVDLQSKHLINAETYRVLNFLSKEGTLGYLKITGEDLAPPTARQLASERATGKYLFFLDNHCLVRPSYFKRALNYFEINPRISMLHSTTDFFVGEQLHYEYKLKLDTNFWAESKFRPKDPQLPYRVAAGGHGGFAVTRDSWEDVGGYWKGFAGYAGEELTTDLQYWMRGHEVYLDPRMIHSHWSGKRSYSRHFTDDYYRNLMMSANIIGGEKYLWRTYETFVKSSKLISNSTMYDLLEESYYLSREESARVANRSTRSLEQVIKFFEAENISH